MSETKTEPSPNTTPAGSNAAPRQSFITPEMIEKNPVLAAAGMFADDPYWLELIAEIKKERARQRRRERRELSK